MTDVFAPSSQALLQQGVSLLQQGRAPDAWRAFHEVLRLDPANALAHHMVGAMAMLAGQLETGVESLKRSIALNPADPVAYGNLGNGLRELGHVEEALQAYAGALALEPRSAGVLNNRAALFNRLGRNDEALIDYDRALALDPASALLHGNRASVLSALGRHKEAIAAYEQAVILDPKVPGSHYNLATLLAEALQRPRALASFNRAIALKRGYVEAHVGRGNVLRDLGRSAEALADYDQAIMVDPGFIAAHSRRGDVLRRLSRFDEALASVERALSLSPADAASLNDLGNILFALGRHDGALDAYDRAVRADPSYFSAWNDRGLSLHTLMRLDEAQASFDRAIALRPGRPGVTLNMSMLALLRGDYAGGWRIYEARKAVTSLRGGPNPGHGRREWSGDEPVEGRTLLLISEQGLGDSLQFCRYAGLLADRGARVLIQVEKPLVRLLSTLRGVDQVIEKDAPPPDFDAYALMMSLPLAMGTSTPESIPGAPYLSSDPAQTTAFAERMGPRSRPRVGLVWSGGFRPDQPEIWSLNARRNIPLRLLAPLAQADVEFYSLQKGEAAENELAGLVASGWNGPAMVDWTGELNDFADTAALIANLDLVIAVDTSTAHLAGALGKPVWILNRFDICWRWMLERADSPWYPAARLFRQKSFDDWGPVVDEVAEALEAFRP